MTTQKSPNEIELRVQRAHAAAPAWTTIGAAKRSAILRDIATELENDSQQATIFRANAEDLRQARDAQARGELSAALVARLELPAPKLRALATGLRQLAAGREWVGEVLTRTELDEGLVLERTRCPLGEIGRASCRERV